MLRQFFELDVAQYFLELLARVETRQHVGDQAGIHFALFLRAFRSAAQPHRPGILREKLPKSPNSTILPSASSCGMMVNRDSSTARVSGLLTVHICVMRCDNWRRVIRPLDWMDG